MMLRKLATPFKPLLEWLAQIECRISRRWVYESHRRLMRVQWNLPPEPEHFDHHINIFHSWPKTRNSLGLERGCFGSLALQGGRVLELSCGDGFNARNFYSLRSKEVVACDFDASAIKTAKAKNSADNVRFELADIRTAMPEGKFENIAWDGAIEHFTPAEIDGVLAAIKSRLTPNGVVSGYTVAERPGGKQLSHHEYEFKDKEDLRRFFTPHFKCVTVFETIYSMRHNLYFWASDNEASVPLSPSWPHSTTG